MADYSTAGNPPAFTKYSFSPSALSPQGREGMNPFDAAIAKYAPERSNGRADSSIFSSLMMRRLPMSMSQDMLRGMLIFAKDCVNVEFVSRSLAEDTGYKTAIATFRSATAADEARVLHDGKPSASGEAMIVESVERTPGGTFARQPASFDPREQRPPDPPPIGTNSHSNRPASKFNNTFQALDRRSPPRLSSLSRPAESSAYPPASLFAGPQSPHGRPLDLPGVPRVSGKSVIGEDGVDDDTGALLHDPVAYATQNENNLSANNRISGATQSQLPPMPPTRRSTMPQIPTSRFSSLSINPNGNNSGATPPSSGLASPRSNGPLQSPTSFAPGGPPFSQHHPSTANYPLPSPQHHAFPHPHAPPPPHFPPVNPADQNPPCNTLYVGNLPIDTAEDELKALFSQQRGYKRLCFRTKGNGPMCFVEFEDVGFATKALTELYGWPLSNSVKGGIRLSFSKNPLGVRTNGPSAGGPGGLPSPLSPGGLTPGSTGLNGLAGVPTGGFATASGPPPGIPTPPGLLPTNGGTSLGAGGPLSAPLNGGFPGFSSPTNLGGLNNSPMRSPSVTSAGAGWNF